MWNKGEEALKKTMEALAERLDAKTHSLDTLSVGDFVLIQNQYGRNPAR